MPPKKKAASGSTPIPAYNVYEDIKVIPSQSFVAPELDASVGAKETADILEQVNSKHDRLIFGITDIPNDVCGRRVVARKDIAPGTTVVVVSAIS